MHIDEQSAEKLSPEELAPEDWTLELIQEGLHVTGVVCRDGEQMCRLSTFSDDRDEEPGRTVLAPKARAWIHDYLARSGP